MTREEQQRSGFQYQYSVFELELSRNLLFARGSTMDEVYQKLIDRTRQPLELEHLKTIFGFRHRPRQKLKRGGRGPEVAKAVQGHGYDLTVFKVQWGRVSRDIYLQDRPLEACDPATFELLKDSWQKDSQCAYREGRKVPNADVGSYEVLNFWFAKDRNQVYDSFPRVIEGADAATFKLRGGICQVCAQDKNNCYRYEEVVACEAEK